MFLVVDKDKAARLIPSECVKNHLEKPMRVSKKLGGAVIYQISKLYICK